jgi:hypothetical protein
MLLVPVAMPETTPDAAPTVATVASLLLQTPPEIADERVVVDPTHVLSVPEIPGTGFTVTTCVAMQPVERL